MRFHTFKVRGKNIRLRRFEQPAPLRSNVGRPPLEVEVGQIWGKYQILVVDTGRRSFGQRSRLSLGQDVDSGEVRMIYLQKNRGKPSSRRVNEAQLVPVGWEATAIAHLNRVRLGGKSSAGKHRSRTACAPKGLQPEWDPATYTEYGKGETWKRLRDAFVVFARDVGCRPGSRYTFHRINDNVGYYRGNGEYVESHETDRGRE